MAVQDLWYKRDPTTHKKVKSARYGRGLRWRTHWTDPDTGKPRSESFEKQAQADAKDAEVRNSINQGRYLDPARGAMLLRDYAEQWRAAQPHSDGSRAKVESAFRVHVNPYLGDLPLRDIRMSRLQSWITELDGLLAPQSVRNVWQHVAGMFKFAVTDRVLGINPCTGVKLPALDKRLKGVPTTDMVLKLIAATDEAFQPVLYLAAGCGLRGGEIFGLEADCVDWDAGTIEIRQQIRKLADAPSFLGPPKTISSNRFVDMPPVVAEALAGLTPVKHHLWDRTNKRRAIQKDASLFFETPQSHLPYTAGSWGQVVTAAAKKAGLGGQGITLHGLRHYFATYLIMRGASVKRVQAALGHAKPTTTLDTYVGYWPDIDTDAADLLDQALRG